MAENLKTKSVLIADNGLFSELAGRLARDFGQVLYYMPWANAYPRAAPAFVGVGLPGVERIATFWDRVPDVDLVVFPDLYFADVQEVVRDHFHKPVFGHRWGENLELDRRGMRKLQVELGIPAPLTRFITGVDHLERYLEHVEDRWVKISTYRGDGETWHHTTWPVSKVYLDHFRNRVGALASSYEFLVEEPLEGVEIGYDGWTVKGEFPPASYWGFEVKDEGYIGRYSPAGELPAAIRFLNGKLAPLLAEERSVGFCSFEFRLGKEGRPYLIDPCMRLGSPPFEVLIEAYDNLAEIIWGAAQGEMVPPRPLGKYVALAEIHSLFALTNWVPVAVPAPLRRWVKLRNAAILEGNLYHVPQVGAEMPEIGAVGAVADSLEEAIALVQERASQVQGYNLEVKVSALEEAEEQIDKAREYGVEF